MRIGLKIICKQDNADYYIEKIKLIIKQIKASNAFIEKDCYWKEKRCSDITSQMNAEYLDSISVENIIVHIIDLFKDGVRIVTDQTVELNVYVSIPEILQQNKVFLSLYISDK